MQNIASSCLKIIFGSNRRTLGFLRRIRGCHLEINLAYTVGFTSVGIRAVDFELASAYLSVYLVALDL
jgi:hypothetical protein